MAYMEVAEEQTHTGHIFRELQLYSVLMADLMSGLKQHAG